MVVHTLLGLSVGPAGIHLPEAPHVHLLVFLIVAVAHFFFTFTWYQSAERRTFSLSNNFCPHCKKAYHIWLPQFPYVCFGTISSQGVLINLNQSVVDKILVRICFFDLTHPQFLGWLGLGYVEMSEM